MTNAFRRFLEAGYTRLIPITPPGAPVSERSSLFKRQKDLGKAPGVLRDDGTWQGVDWMKLTPTEADLDAWAAMGAGTGLRLGAGLIAVDIDTMDGELGNVCGQLATKHMGASENRVGRAPKRLKLYRITEDVAYRRLSFDGGHVEILTEGKQCVVAGVHPGTGKPYEWPRGVPTYDRLPLITPQQLDAYFEALAKAVPAAKVDVASLPKDHAAADPSQLRSNEADVRKAVQALPNTHELFPTYADYVQVGQAIRGALPDDPELGLELFQEWAAKYDPPAGADGNDPERVAADWRRIQPSHSIGAQFLYSLAERHGAGAFHTADTWFSGSLAGAPPAGLNAFEAQAADTAPTLEPISWRDPADWQGVEPPVREWEVKDWIPRYEVTLLYGEGGVGKTLVAQQYATAAAAGKHWLNQATRQAKVMCLFCEDGEDELHRRQLDICRHYGIEPSALRGRLRIASRKYMDNLLAIWTRNTGEMKRTAVWEQLRADAVAWGADVVIVDTVADTFGGSEIDRTQVNAFVKSCLGRLAQEINGSVIALAHPSVGGRAEGRSGSTAWANAARSRMYLQYPKGKETGNWRELSGTKTNYAAMGAQIRLKWSRGAFEAVASRQPEVDLNALKNPGDAVAGMLPTIESVSEAAVLAALAEAQTDGLPLNLSPRSSAYAPKVLKQFYGRTLELVKVDDIHQAVIDLQARGVLRVSEWWMGGNKVRGFAVVSPGAAASGWFQPAGSVFD